MFVVVSHCEWNSTQHQNDISPSLLRPHSSEHSSFPSASHSFFASFWPSCMLHILWDIKFVFICCFHVVFWREKERIPRVTQSSYNWVLSSLNINENESLFHHAIACDWIPIQPSPIGARLQAWLHSFSPILSSFHFCCQHFLSVCALSVWISPCFEWFFHHMLQRLFGRNWKQA